MICLLHSNLIILICFQKKKKTPSDGNKIVILTKTARLLNANSYMSLDDDAVL